MDRSEVALLGCSGDDPLQSLNLSLGLQRVSMTRHLLFPKAAILHAVRIIEKEAGFVVLERSNARVSA